MIDAVRYEIVRLRTLRSTWWLFGISLVATAGIAALICLAATDPTGELVGGGGRGLAMALSAGGDFAPVPIPPVLVGIVGAFAFGHEYRYGTIRPTLTALPRRSTVMVAKVLVVATWSVIVGLLNLVVAYVVCLVYPGQDLTEGVDWEPAGRVAVGLIVLMVIWSLVGLGLAGLTRNLPMAIVLLLVVPMVVEAVLFGLLLFVEALEPVRWLAKYLPFSAGQQMVTVLDADDFGAPIEVDLATPLEGGIIFGTFAAILLVVTWVLFRRRDA